MYRGEVTQKWKYYAREIVLIERRLELVMACFEYFDLQHWDNGSGFTAETINSAIDYHKSVEGYEMRCISKGRF